MRFQACGKSATDSGSGRTGDRLFLRASICKIMDGATSTPRDYRRKSARRKSCSNERYLSQFRRSEHAVFAPPFGQCVMLATAGYFVLLANRSLTSSYKVGNVINRGDFLLTAAFQKQTRESEPGREGYPCGLAVACMSAGNERRVGIAILGAGPTGIGAAWRLSQRPSSRNNGAGKTGDFLPFLLIDESTLPGGRAASFTTPKVSLSITGDMFCFRMRSMQSLSNCSTK